MLPLSASTIHDMDPEAPAGLLPRPAVERFRVLQAANSSSHGEPILTGDGRELRLRSIQDSDGPLLQRCFSRLSAQEIRRRFMYALAELSPRMLHRLSHIDPQLETALCLIEPHPSGPELHAVARAYVDPTTLSAEFSLMVEQSWARQGLGRLLMQRLLDDCRQRGLQELWGYVLAENQPMMRLCRSLGFEARLAPQEPGTVVLSCSLQASRS